MKVFKIEAYISKELAEPGDIHCRYAETQEQSESHGMEIEVGRYAQIYLEGRICQLCHQGVESEDHYVCHCSFFMK